VEGDGNQQIYWILPVEALKNRMQQFSKKLYEREYPVIFKSMDLLFHCPLIKGAGAMGREIPPLLQARGAKVSFLCSRRVREAATRAIRGAYGSDCLAAIRTDDGGCPSAAEEGVADGAARREDKVQ
jgi:hypothetical protein